MNAATIRAVIGGTLLMASSLVSASAAQPLLLHPISTSNGSMTVFTLLCLISLSDFPTRLSRF